MRGPDATQEIAMHMRFETNEPGTDAPFGFFVSGRGRVRFSSEHYCTTERLASYSSSYQ